METYLKKWYKGICEKSNKLSLDKIYPSFDQGFASLENVYVDQNTINNAKFGIGRRIANSQALNPDKTDNLILLEDKIVELQSNRIAILGDLGSGKTCFVNHLASTLAHQKLDDKKRSESAFVRKYYDKFVALIQLKEVDFSSESMEQNFIQTLLSYSANDFLSKTQVPIFLSGLNTNLSQGAILILDGYDEIDAFSRSILLKAIEDFCKDETNTVILTARTYMYEAYSQDFQDFSCLRIEPFNKKQIVEYIENWVRYYNVKIGNFTNVHLDSKSIAKDVFSKQYIMDLTGCPLFLSLLLLLYTDKAEKGENQHSFPVSRTLLYKEIVHLLLTRWNDDIDVSIAEKVLEEASFYDLKKNAISDLLPELLRSFTNYNNSDNPRKLIDTLADRTGLILRVGKEQYSFLHRSFQEYFAAGYIINHEDFVKTILENIANYERWKECDVFIISRLGNDKLYTATALLNLLVPAYSSKSDCNIAKLCIASESLIEILQIQESSKSMLLPLVDNLRKWLVSSLGKAKLPYQMRFRMGDYLSRIGDTRKGIGTKIIKNNVIPDIDWVCIEGGEFLFGGDDEEVNITRTQAISEYYISKYPITNKQYSLFILDGGYENKSYWTLEGKKWLDGNDYPYFSEISGNRYSEERLQQYQEWQASRTKEKRTRPFWWDEEPWNIDNRPVVGINWYEACAFCSWLNSKMSIWGQFYKFELDTEIHLPTLEEWEHAARGPKSFIYPWGNKIDQNKLRGNFENCNLNQTSTVGIFPEGKSKYGVFDCSGNVYEWVSTGLSITADGSPHLEQDLKLDDPLERLVKGGAWNFDYERAACSYDEWDFPIVFDQNTGFRVVAKRRINQ